MQVRQKGMSLLLVLLLTLMASLLVFSALNNAISQERMSGNFQKKLNAELLADQAVFESYHQLNRFVREPANANKTDAELAAAAAVAVQNLSGGRSFTTTAATLTATGLTVDAAGNRYQDSLATRRVLFRKVTESGSQQRPFGHAVTGCEGVNLSASGGISSYDSSNPAATGTNVVVQTVNSNGHVELSGAAPIEGDVLSRGNISLAGSAVITGRVHANGDIWLNNGSATIQKEVWARGNIHINSTVKLLAELKTNQALTITAPTKLAGGIKVKGHTTVSNYGQINPVGQPVEYGTIASPVQIQGNLLLSADYIKAVFDDLAAVQYSGTANPAGIGQKVALDTNQFPDVPLLAIDNNDRSSADFNPICDALDIAPQVEKMEKPATLTALHLTEPDTVYQLSNTQGQFLQPDRPTGQHSPANTKFLGQSIRSYFFSELNLTNSELQISGDITIYVRDRMQLGANAKLRILDNSTLTLISSGKIIFSADAKLLNQQGGKPEGIVNQKPVFAIYSAFAGLAGEGNAADKDKAGIDISGAADGIYAAIYAPLTDIKIAGIGRGNYFAGAALGKKVSIGGDGLIRYDQALGKIGGGGVVKPQTPPRIVFNGW
jgi:Tfp pilus assembly protein PilX